nr:ABC transporter permease [candidate division Zixibacteria bacterium]
MSKLWIVISREYAQVVKKKSFLVGIFLTPIFMIMVTILPALLAQKKSSSTENIAIIDLDNQGIGERFREVLAEYKIDDGRPAYDVREIYYADPQDSSGIASIRRELDSLINAKELKMYLVLNRGIENNDSCIMVAKSFGFVTGSRLDRGISRILAGRRLEKSNINLAVDSVLHLARSVEFTMEAPGGKKRDFLTLYLAGIVFVMIIFMTVIGYGQILMRAVIEEKNSRIIEVLVSSISPFQLMAGKIIGMGLASLTQLGIWILIGAVIYNFKGTLNINADISGVIFNPVLIVYFVIYLILGYLLFSTLFAFIGSIVNSDKEAQNFIFPITMILLLPVLIAMNVVQEPDSTLATTLSLIPFFTPTMMILRLNIIGVDHFSFSEPIIFQATLGVILTIITILIVTWITSRVFRIGILMYGKRPTLPEILRWMRYK